MAREISADVRRPALHRPSPLRLRLLGLVAVAFLPVLLLVARLSVNERHATMQRARESTLRLIDAALVEQRDLVHGGQELLGSLAKLPDIDTGSPATCSRALTRLFGALPNYTSATRVDATLHVDCASGPIADSLRDVSQDPVLQRAASTGQPVDGYYHVNGTGEARALVVLPVFDTRGRVRFLLCLEAENTWFNQLSASMPPAEGAIAAVIDSSGFVYARTPDREAFAGRRHAVNSALREMVTRGSGALDGQGLDGRTRMYAFRRLPAANEATILVTIGLPIEVVYADANHSLNQNLLVAAVTLLLALFMAWLAADLFVLRDVRAFLGATRRLAEGDLSTRVTTPSKRGELHELAGQFNDMARHLEERRREFITLGDASPDAIARISRDLRIEWANVALVGRLGVTLDDLVGTPLTEIRVDVPRSTSALIIDRVRQVLSSNQPSEAEISIRTGRGDVWVDLRFAPERDPAGQVSHVTVIARDVTARRHLETHLAQAERLDSIGKLAGSISHDFNNLLTAIIGNAEIALRTLEPDHPVRDDLLEILDVARRASSLTRQLLSFARRQPTTVRVIDPKPFIEETAALLRRLMGASITLELNIDTAAPRIRFDPTHLEQVLVNLATNARDAMPSGGTLTISAAPVSIADRGQTPAGAPPPGDYLVVTVADSGVGMSEEVRRRLFEPFFTTKRDQDGTGLGLAVTYGVVRQHGGFIDVDSVEGQGTTFRIYFPATRAPVEYAAPAASLAPSPTGREALLLVEDQDSVRATIARLLRSHGYSVIEASDGMDVLERREAGELPSFQLMITDLVMPRMGGEALVTAMKEHYPNLPVLLISGFDERGSARRLIERGDAVALLEKPFEAPPLLRLVRDMLDAAADHATV